MQLRRSLANWFEVQVPRDQTVWALEALAAIAIPDWLKGSVPEQWRGGSAHAKAIVMTGTALARAVKELVAMGSKTRTVCQPAGR
jgi:hypothetical protein